MESRPQDSVQQDISRVPIEGVIPRNSLFQLNLAIHPKLAAGGGGQTHEVGLDGTRDQNGIGFLETGLAQVEFQLSDLVPAERKIGAVIAFDVDSCPSQRIA